jgi:hypothetical protein
MQDISRTTLTAVALAGQLLAGQAHALTVYTDPTAWQLAVSGASVGTYPHQMTRTDRVWSINYDPSSINERYRIGDSRTDWFGPWSNNLVQNRLLANFSYAGNTIDQFCWHVAACHNLPSLGETVVSFEASIAGLAGIGRIATQVNGVPVYRPDVGFIGLVLDADTLDFYTGPNIEDSFLGVDLEDVVVAWNDPPPTSLTASVTQGATAPSSQVPEPGSLTLLVGAVTAWLWFGIARRPSERG